MRVAPRAVSSDADDACFLASGYGLTPDDWQEDVLDDWLGRRRDGRWAAATCGLAVPRQNGKNGIIEVRELFGMVELGEKFLHTAHEVKTARKAFLRIASFFENPREFPELTDLVKEIRKTNGQEAVILKNGGSVEFIARSRGSGRGFTVDVLVCDEAQDLTDEELAALLPTISASPTGNPQVILTGTPPDPEKGQQGEVFRRVRADGEAERDKRLAWTDFGAPDGPLPDIANRVLWGEWNPALGIRLAVAEVERELALMSPERFAAERGGWWGDPEAEASRAFPAEAWKSCRDDTVDEETGLAASKILGIPSVALDVSPDHSAASITVAGRRADGRKQIEVVDHDRAQPGVRYGGTAWVVARVKQVVQGCGAAGVRLDPAAAAGALIQSLRDAGVHVIEVTGREYTQACGAIYDAVEHGTMRHLGQAELDAAVRAARPKLVGEDAWKWARRNITENITPLVSATIALAGVVDGSVSVFSFADLDGCDGCGGDIDRDVDDDEDDDTRYLCQKCLDREE